MIEVPTPEGPFTAKQDFFFEVLVFDESHMQLLAGDPEDLLVDAALSGVAFRVQERGVEGSLSDLARQINYTAKFILKDPKVYKAYLSAHEAAKADCV